MSCPICGEQANLSSRPFCSPRCADLDLAKWLNGAYAIPSNDLEDLENAMKEAEEVENRSAGQLPTRH